MSEVNSLNGGNNSSESNNTEIGKMFKSPYNHSGKSTHFSTGSKIQAFAVIMLILDVIGVICLTYNGFDISVLIASALGGAVLFTFFYGFGEIIDRLISIDEGITRIKNSKRN